MFKLLLFSHLITSLVANSSNMLLQANCARPLTPGTTIMSAAAISDPNNQLVVKRLVAIQSGTTVYPGETITVETPSDFPPTGQYVIQVTNAVISTAGSGCRLNKIILILIFIFILVLLCLFKRNHIHIYFLRLKNI